MTYSSGQASTTISLANSAVGSHSIGASFAGDSQNAPSTATGSLEVTQATPFITWPAHAAIAYGTPLSAVQLNATADVPGTLAYDPPSGTVLNAGSYTLRVTFTPTDTATYSTATAMTTQVVSKAYPVVTWAVPAPITYGTPLSAAQLNATANASGSF